MALVVAELVGLLSKIANLPIAVTRGLQAAEVGVGCITDLHSGVTLEPQDGRNKHDARLIQKQAPSVP